MDSLIREKSFDFAVRVTELCTSLIKKEKEYVLSKQLLRSGTSIGANVREALNCQTKRDFVYKLSISQKECDETLYWLELLFATDLISSSDFSTLHAQATSLLKILRSIILTTKKNYKL